MDLTSDAIWVTRDEPEGGRLSALLAERDVPIVHAPLVRLQPLGDGGDAVSRLGPDDWLVLSSPRAVELVAEAVGARRPMVAVVGEMSASLARARGFPVTFVSPSESSRGIWDHLRTHAGAGRVCFARSTRATPPEDPPSGLEIVDLYDVVDLDVPSSVVDRVAAAVFTSRSAVESCVRQFGSVPVPAISIGPTTTAALREAAADVAAEAETRSLESIADAVADWRSGRW